MTLKAFIEAQKIKAVANWADDNPNMADMPRGSSHWRVTFTRKGKRMTTPFSQGPAISAEPNAHDVLSCLLSDASGADQSFETWCGDYGYDTDSRTAERTYRAVTRQTAKLRAFLGDAFDAAIQCEH